MWVRPFFYALNVWKHVMRLKVEGACVHHRMFRRQPWPCLPRRGENYVITLHSSSRAKEINAVILGWAKARQWLWMIDGVVPSGPPLMEIVLCDTRDHYKINKDLILWYIFRTRSMVTCILWYTIKLIISVSAVWGKWPLTLQKLLFIVLSS